MLVNLNTSLMQQISSDLILTPSLNLKITRIPLVEALTLEKNTAPQLIETRSPEASQALEEQSHAVSQKSLSASDTNRPMPSIHWQSVVMLIWLAGVLLSLFRILVGRIGLHCMIQRSTPITSSHCSSLLHDLSSRLGIRRKVHV